MGLVGIKTGKYAIGTIHKDTTGVPFEIIEKTSKGKVIIKFMDEHKAEMEIYISNIEGAGVRNPYRKTIYGIGVHGVGNHKAKIDGKMTRVYDVWFRIMDRCYNEKSNHKNPSYRNSSVCEEWHNFQNFGDWYVFNYPSIETDFVFNVDKDLLQLGMEYKVYSPSTCVFLPPKVNIFLANVQVNNTSGSAGVSKNKRGNYRAYTSEFGTNTQVHLGTYNQKEDAFESYKIGRSMQAEKAKSYLRTFGYLSEDIIQLIK